MKIKGQYHQSISLSQDGILVLDQRHLPWEIKFVEIATLADAVRAIKEMWVRGAPLIGAVGAFGLSFALREGLAIEQAVRTLIEARPTAINLRWAVEKVANQVKSIENGWQEAKKWAYEIAMEDARLNRQIGEHGLTLFEKHHRADRPLNILTHCNAGWIATMDYGTALAPIYLAHDKGMPLHVWVDETRPRNQGSLLTAFELSEHGVPHTVIADNAGGLLMQRGQVDLCIVGTDRVTRNGDVCNKIGTYLKALAAKANHVPFYVALPYSTLDLNTDSGNEIPIEERPPDEIIYCNGMDKNGKMTTVCTTLSQAYNPAFDITPAELVTAYITEAGVFDLEGLQKNYGIN